MHNFGLTVNCNYCFDEHFPDSQDDVNCRNYNNDEYVFLICTLADQVRDAVLSRYKSMKEGENEHDGRI